MPSYLRLGNKIICVFEDNTKFVYSKNNFEIIKI